MPRYTLNTLQRNNLTGAIQVARDILADDPDADLQALYMLQDNPADLMEAVEDLPRGKKKTTKKIRTTSIANLPTLGDVALDFHAIEKTWKTSADVSRRSYGGAVFDHQGRVLLRRPEGAENDWTLAKGGVEDEDAGPAATAMREVREETGVDADVVGLVPGHVESQHRVSFYFVMRADSSTKPAEHDDETAKTRWFSLKDAFRAIENSDDKKQRRRDADVLEMAVIVLGRLVSGDIDFPPPPPS